MQSDSRSQVTQANLRELRERALRLVAVPVAATGIAWLIVVVWPDLWPDDSWWVWLGSVVLALGPLVGLSLLDRSVRLSSLLVIASTLVAVTCAMLAFKRYDLIYMFCLVIACASVLLVPSLTLALASLTLLVQIAVLHLVLDIPIFSFRIALPVIVTAAIAAASILTARTLYAALGWVWQGYEQALNNERIARDTSADLRQALRSLDEATYRLERTNRMLDLAREQAEEARQLKQRFAQNISHELRTPLNLIVEFTGMMAHSPEYYGTPLAAGYIRDLSIVYRNARHLQSLVSDVLDLARIEAAQVGLILENADPGELVREAVATARSLVEAKGLRLREEIAPQIPELRIDATRIRQVLFNLLNNAARFTDEGVVTVAVKQQASEVVFSVSDTGVGIPAEDIPRVFREFEQLDGGTRRRHGGVGLGLSISRGFVELHGGRIWAESQVGKGTIFSFALPIEPMKTRVTAARWVTTPRRLATSKGDDLLLVVTKSLSGGGILSRHMQGVRTIVVSDLSQAIEMAKRLFPQGMIVDIASVDIPDGGVAGLARTCGLTDVPIMACPLPGEGSLRRSLAVDGYLIKPITQPALLDVLRPFGEAVDRIQVIDDEQDFVRLLRRFLSTSVRSYQVRSAYTALEGLEMMRQRPPDLLLLDLGLPDVAGETVIEVMRAEGELASIPIVVVSGQEQIDNLRLLDGELVVARSNGLEIGDLIQWMQRIVDTSTRRRGDA